MNQRNAWARGGLEPCVGGGTVMSTALVSVALDYTVLGPVGPQCITMYCHIVTMYCHIVTMYCHNVLSQCIVTPCLWSDSRPIAGGQVRRQS